MEQLIKVIEANSGKSLHYETQQEAKQKANKTKMWYLIIIFLISLAILAVFFIKRETNQATTQATANQALSKKLKPKILATRIKEWQHRSKTQNHSKHKNNKGAEVKER
ncbi:flagellar biosynthesis protein FlgG [Helicobacter pylori]|nr:flagellar biosynthesis protein FlgG [Helicobacter pylori]MDU9765775.1 flagellar biosynthesis protein FlgG [Helicobacter pylori]